MFSNAFDEFSKDPFFDFGYSPFNDHPFYKRRHRAHSQPRLKDAEDERNEGKTNHALVARERHDRPERRRNGGEQSFDDALAVPGFGGGFGGIFEGVNRMMQDMGTYMKNMEKSTMNEDFDGHMYSHSSVYSYSNDGTNEPREYRAMSETHAGPGGVRETRKAMRDSASMEERMAVGRHIGQRGHTIERRRNGRTGDQREDHRYSGIDENNGAAFDEEWQTKAQAIRSRADRHGNDRRLRDKGERDKAAITDGRSERRAEARI